MPVPNAATVVMSALAVLGTLAGAAGHLRLAAVTILLAGLFGLTVVVRALVVGDVTWPDGRVYGRDASPGGFWAHVTLLFVAGTAATVYAAVYLLTAETFAPG